MIILFQTFNQFNNIISRYNYYLDSLINFTSIHFCYSFCNQY